MRHQALMYALTAAAILILATACASPPEPTDDASPAPEQSTNQRTEPSAAPIEDGDSVGPSELPLGRQYTIGRTVAALLLSKYPIYRDRLATEYLNALGTAIALSSPKPILFTGYRFAILDSDEINAFATPGGHIFLTRGIISLARGEAELAAILAHEICHVAFSHGLQSVRTDALAAITGEIGSTPPDALSEAQLSRLADALEQIAADLLDTLVGSGYASEDDFEADVAATRILAKMGYDPRALVRVLERMELALDPDGPGFARTHPEPLIRRQMIESTLQSLEAEPSADAEITELRFDAAMGVL